MISAGLFSRLRALQQFIKEIGFAGSQLSLPAPRLLLLPDPSASEAKEEVLFSQFVTEKEIVDVCRDLFESGFYNQAVCEAYKALDKYIKEKCNNNVLSGTKLMDKVFSQSDPVMVWSKRVTTSEKDEHRGYHFIYSGAFTGIRNPSTHEIDWISDHTHALDAILVAQHLLRRAKLAVLAKKKDEVAGAPCESATG